MGCLLFVVVVPTTFLGLVPAEEVDETLFAVLDFLIPVAVEAGTVFFFNTLMTPVAATVAETASTISSSSSSLFFSSEVLFVVTLTAAELVVVSVPDTSSSC